VTEGDPIERQLEKIINQEEEMDESAELIYTKREDGVLSEYNPRADMWDIAQEIQEEKGKMRVLKRESRVGVDDNVKKIEGKNDGETEPTVGNSST